MAFSFGFSDLACFLTCPFYRQGNRGLGKSRPPVPSRVRDGTDLGLYFLVCLLSTSHTTRRVAKGVGTSVPESQGSGVPLFSSTLAAAGGRMLRLQA